MKILFLSNRLPHANVAGGLRLVHQRMMQLIGRGHQVGLASLIEDEDEYLIKGVRDSLLELETQPILGRKRFVRVFHDYMSSALPAIFWKN